MYEFTVPAGLPDWIQDHVREYLATNGASGHLWDSSERGWKGIVPTLLLVTKGRKTGKTQTLPLIYGNADHGYVVVGSKGGAPDHPAWYLNLMADPNVSIQVGDRRMDAKARTAQGAERAALWKKMVAAFPPYETYEKRTQREIPLVVLEPGQ